MASLINRENSEQQKKFLPIHCIGNSSNPIMQCSRLIQCPARDYDKLSFYPILASLFPAAYSISAVPCCSRNLTRVATLCGAAEGRQLESITRTRCNGRLSGKEKLRRFYFMAFGGKQRRYVRHVSFRSKKFTKIAST